MQLWPCLNAVEVTNDNIYKVCLENEEWLRIQTLQVNSEHEMQNGIKQQDEKRNYFYFWFQLPTLPLKNKTKTRY